MIGPDPTDAINIAVERYLVDLLSSVLAGASPSTTTPDDAGASTTNRKGLGRKYHVVRLDGRDKPDEHHHGCSLFVLDLTHDPAARAALIAYCAAARVARPALVQDLIDQYLQQEG